MTQEAVEQIWLLGERDAVSSAFQALRQSISSTTDQILMSASRRDLWRDGQRMGMATQIHGYARSLIDLTRSRPLPSLVQTISVRHAPGADSVHVRGMDGSVDYFIDTPGLPAQAALAHAARHMQDRGLHPGQPAQPSMQSGIAQATWQGAQAVHELLPTLAWTPGDIEQWWRSLRDWLHMFPCLADEDGNPLWGQAWTRDERKARIFALMQALPGIEREPDAMAAYCLGEIHNELSEQGKQAERELRQATLGQWLSPGELWARADMKISLSQPNSAWTQSVFQALPTDQQHACLAEAWDRWTRLMGHLAPAHLPSLSPQLPDIWRCTQDWPEWPALLAHWHNMGGPGDGAADMALRVIDAERQQQHLERGTGAVEAAPRRARL